MNYVFNPSATGVCHFYLVSRAKGGGNGWGHLHFTLSEVKILDLLKTRSAKSKTAQNMHYETPGDVHLMPHSSYVASLPEGVELLGWASVLSPEMCPVGISGESCFVRDVYIVL